PTTTTTTSLKRQDSTGSLSGRGSHKSSSAESSSSSSSKKAERDGSGSNKNSSIEKVTNGPDSSHLPFNHYVNGNADGRSSNSSSTNSSDHASATVNHNNSSNKKKGHSTPLSPSLPPFPQPQPSHPAHLPQPLPVEEIQSHEHYMKEGKNLKRTADGLKEKSSRYYELYLQSGLSYLLACYTQELKHGGQNSSISYNDTNRILSLYNDTNRM
ncbi:hypothetical protein EGW08_004021, partial [Elysia chlorotica]